MKVRKYTSIVDHMSTGTKDGGGVSVMVLKLLTRPDGSQDMPYMAAAAAAVVVVVLRS
jgi:hypothetical protein